MSTSTRHGGRFCGAEPDAELPTGSARSGEPEWALVQGNSPVGFAACGLDGQLRNAPQARHFVAATLNGWALHTLVPDVAVVVSELVTNAVQHALDPTSPDDGDYPVWLGIFLHPGDLVCAVTDPSSDPPRPRDADADACAVGGRGLRLISALSDTWSWSLTPPRGKTVWATLPLHPQVS
ncbi:ATP-binding protein [Streptomyces sp. V1I1]|uniref:ATP-binding protein n=1 Tax=Streptomyces sp. V1I1 TaxID=3042272 RepID=UPI0027D7B477|nr:ATP-binding protein [Streptomyces sp. V1I1]